MMKYCFRAWYNTYYYTNDIMQRYLIMLREERKYN